MNTATNISSGGRKRAATTWAHVVQVLTDSERSSIVANLLGSGFSIENFARYGAARSVVANALTRLEDRLELQAIDAGGAGRGRAREALNVHREAIAEIRRQLETESDR